MNQIVVIKTNGFFDIIESNVWIDDDYGVDIYSIECCLENVDNGIFLIKFRNYQIVHVEGEMGDFGRYDVEPYTYLDNPKVIRKCELNNYITKSEKKAIRQSRDERRAKRLQKYVSSFSDETTTYSLCKIWGSHDKLALRTVTGSTFQQYKTIHTFEDATPSVSNCRNIKNWLDGYLFNKMEEIAQIQKSK